MVLPITGPFSESYAVGIGVGSYYTTRQIYRQSKPYNLPLPYSRDQRGVGIDVGWGTSSSSTNTSNAAVFGTRSPIRYSDLPSWFKTSVLNQARERLQGKIRPEALLLATLYEARQTIHTMADRIDQATALTKGLPRFMLSAARRASLVARLGKVGVKGVGKSLADGVLEVYFGYKPIMSDIDACAETLSKEFDPETVDASAKRRDTRQASSVFTGSKFWKDEEWWYKVKCGCEAQITNPNLALAQSLGLVNPFATAWELMPWSFVVDYFINVNQFVNCLTDEYGVALSKPFTRETMWSFSLYRDQTINVATKAIIGGYDTGIWYRAARASTTLPSVRLGVRQFSLGKDLSRLVTSSALLLQALTRR